MYSILVQADGLHFCSAWK